MIQNDTLRKMGLLQNVPKMSPSRDVPYVPKNEKCHRMSPKTVYYKLSSNFPKLPFLMENITKCH